MPVANVRQKLIGALLGALLAMPSIAMAGPDEEYKAGLEAFDGDDQVRAMDHLTKAAEAGHLRAMVTLGELLDKAEEDPDAIKWFRAAADKKDPEGILNLGLMIAYGEGIEKNEDEGVRLVTQAATLGLPRAMLFLSDIYRLGKMNQRIDYDKSVEWLGKAAEISYPPAVKQMAEVYRKGLLGYDPDPQLAKEWEEEYRTLVKPKGKVAAKGQKKR